MISLVIPTFNAENYIEQLLMTLWSQRIKPDEILAIDSSSDDNTRHIATSCGAKVISIERKDFDHGGTRNLGVKASAGDIIIFLTQDALPVNEYLIENLINPLQEKDIPLSYGRQIPKNNASPVERFARFFNYPDTPLVKGKEHLPLLGIKTFFCSNVCLAVRRKQFEEVGGFPERVIMNEDMMLAAKLILKGYKSAYQPTAVVSHSHSYFLVEQFKRYFDIGSSLNQNKWIFEHTKPEGEGFRFLKHQIIYLLKELEWQWIPYMTLEALAKYTGYRLGLIEDKIPIKLKTYLSMHKHFWKTYDKTAKHPEKANLI